MHPEFPRLHAEATTTTTSFTPQNETNPATTTPPEFRHVVDLQQYPRLPVWPAWNGVFLWIVSKVLGPRIAAELEDKITGRVCPNFFQENDQTSPFIMLVHHCHTFAPIDPLRFIQRSFFPEGFPAHPHRGFVTLTYFLEGGFRHRDSMGIEQVYGQKLDGISHHSQWLSTGAGLLHEEMFYEQEWWKWQRQELYQLWINLPGSKKMTPPCLLLLGDKEETPVLRDNGVFVRVLAGTYNDLEARVPTASNLTVLHVALEPDTTWAYSLPETYETAIIYVRKGSIDVGGGVQDLSNTVTIPAHHTAFMSRSGRTLQVYTKQSAADFLLLAGAPLNEPVAAQGSMVMRYPNEIIDAYRDYQYGLFGRPWPHTYTREEWLTHVQQNPSSYIGVSMSSEGADGGAPVSQNQSQSKL